MANQTTMIFITSDEDFVRQLPLNEARDTHIIDLDDHQQVTSLINTNNKIFNWARSAGLLEFNSNNDQISKRPLDSPQDDDQSKQVKTFKKPADFICKICHDHAIGFNYDVLSCGSCKAFFHRYGHQDLEKLMCSKGNEQCMITVENRSECHRCRLKQCFNMGMRKDFILNRKEIQRRKDFGEKQNLPSKLTNISIPSVMHTNLDHVVHKYIDFNGLELLPIEDLIIVDTVQTAFLSVFQNQSHTSNNSIDISNRSSALISWSQSIQDDAFLMIKFCRLIGEFESLQSDDRFILIKYNLLSLFCTVIRDSYQSTANCSLYREHEKAENKRQLFMLCDQSYDLYEQMIDVTTSFIEIANQDQALMSLLSIILLFSKGLSMNANEPSLGNSLSIYRIQSHYTKVLWNYLINKQGETKTYKLFIQLLTGLFRLQTAITKFREFFQTQIMISQTVDQIAPLMHTILQIS